MLSIANVLRHAGLGVALVSLAGCGLPPEVVLTSGPASQSPISSYTALGDSITAGLTLDSISTEAYASIIAANRGWTLNNFARGGDQACDVFPQQISPHRVGVDVSTGTAYSLLVGTNDADIKGVGAYEPVFSNCHLAVLTWVGTRPSDKAFPGDPSITLSGACTGNSGDAAFVCAAAGTITAKPLLSNGPALYVWYGMDDASSATLNFTVAVDDVLVSSARVRQVPDIATHNGSSLSIGVLRIPATAGTHVVRIATATGGITILAIGTNRTRSPIAVAVGDVPNQRLSDPVAPVSTQLAYTARVRANVDLAVADGLDVRYVKDRDVMLGTSAEMSDPLHPNQYGHRHLAVAFSAALP